MATTARVAALANPLTDWPWDCEGPCDEGEFRALVSVAAPVSTPVGRSGTAAEHAGRVRFLMAQGWDDPRAIAVGIPAVGYWGPSWPVTDGNHRLAAALIRGDRHVSVEVDGQLSHAAKLLGVNEATMRGSE